MLKHFTQNSRPLIHYSGSIRTIFKNFSVKKNCRIWHYVFYLGLPLSKSMKTLHEMNGCHKV
uniref:Uncharacterized protein n=1 Tax=Anguilla anguilla TaxID=7936 RepID=A0A0E9X507_ANGAN